MQNITMEPNKHFIFMKWSHILLKPVLIGSFKMFCADFTKEEVSQIVPANSSQFSFEFSYIKPGLHKNNQYNWFCSRLFTLDRNNLRQVGNRFLITLFKHFNNGLKNSGSVSKIL